MAAAYGVAVLSLGILPPALRVPAAILLLLLVPGVLLLRAFRLPPEPAIRFVAFTPIGGAGVVLVACVILEAAGALLDRPRRLDGAAILAAVGAVSVLLAFRGDPHFRLPRPKVEPAPAALAILSAALLLAAVHAHDHGGPRWPILLGFALVGLSALLPLLRESPAPGTSILALTCAGIALLVARSATTGFLIGGDVYSEYEGFLTTITAGSAFVPGRMSILTSSLGVSHFPAAISMVGGLSPLATFKVAMPAFLVLLFLLVYAFGAVLVGPRLGYGAALFALFQIPSLHLLTGQLRVGVATIFFTSLLIAMFSPDLGRSVRVAWVVFIGALLTMSYYMAPLLVLVLLVLVMLSHLALRRPRTTVLTPAVALTLGTMVLVWWDTLGTAEGLKAYVLSTKAAIGRVQAFLEGRFLPRQIHEPATNHWIDYFLLASNYAAFLLVIAGAFLLLRRSRRFPVAGTDLGVFAVVAAGVAGVWLLVPGLSNLYAGDRLLLQLIPLLALAFVVSADALKDRWRRLRLLPVLVLAGLFILNTHLAHAALGVPRSEIFDHDSETRMFVEVIPSEVDAADWMLDHRPPRAALVTTHQTQPGRNLFVYTDRPFEPSVIPASPVTDRSIYGELILVRQLTLEKGVFYAHTVDDLGSAYRRTAPAFAARWESGNLAYDAGGARVYVHAPAEAQRELPKTM